VIGRICDRWNASLEEASHIGKRARPNRRGGTCRWRYLVASAMFSATCFQGSAAVAGPSEPARTIVPIANGDETVVVTNHHINTRRGPLTYEARAGRLPIRNEQTGEVRGYIFFVAYHVTNSGAGRPITFLWNGGPTSPAWKIHTRGAGPRLRRGSSMVDNPDTILADSDLVFMDPVETGFSRPAKPEYAAEFLQFQGDIAATVEFIRSYRARFRANEQPLFIAGESYGVFRGAAVTDALIRRGVKVTGTILISGDIPNIPQPPEFYDAMHVPARTATAFFYKRLPPALMRDRETAIKEALAWARTEYQPALARKAQLTDAEREKIAHDLALYTGIPADLVDRKTLVVPVNIYLAQFFGGDLSRVLNETDTRIIGAPADPEASILLDRYLRDELQYPTDLTYRGLEQGYMPSPGPKSQSTSEQFYFNQNDLAAEGWAYYKKTGEINALAQVNPPWIIDALERDKDLQLFVLTGRYDPLNMCEGDVIVTAQLPVDLSSRILNRCYEGGHSIYMDEAARLVFSRDVSNFIRDTMARQAR
jgi:hypothetical protein